MEVKSKKASSRKLEPAHPGCEMFKVILCLLTAVVLISFTYQYTHTTWLSIEFWSQHSTALRNAGLLIVAGLGLIVATFRGFVAHETNKIADKNLIVAERSQVTTAFTSAIEQLGSESLAIRLGGIYALAKIAEDHPRQYKSVIAETLQAFVRGTSYFGQSYEEHISRKIKEQNGAVYADLIHAKQKCIDNQDEDPETCYQSEVSDKRYQDELIQPVPDENAKEDIRAAIVIICELGAHEANLTNCYLAGVKFPPADFSGADLSGSNLSRANLSGSRFIGAKLADTNFSGAYLGEASFRKATLEHAVMDRVNAAKVSFEMANLSNARLTDSLLAGSRFLKANLQDANLSGCDLQSADLSGANTAGTNFEGALLTDVCYSSGTTDEINRESKQAAVS